MTAALFFDSVRALLAIGVFGTGVLCTAPSLSAEEAHFDLSAPDSIKQALEHEVGKRVRMKLVSGQDLDGKIIKVGSQAVHLAELTGMDFFDAVIRLDQVGAVIIKVRTK
ncbi:MAG: hypothetical protein ACREJU_09000 [Nitrospiraceae bacterium]